MSDTNLNSCSTEPIHIPGKIQSHGFLIGVDKNSYKVSVISDNAFPGSNNLLGLHIDQLSLNLSGASLKDMILACKQQNDPDLFNPHELTINNESYNLIIHNSHDLHLLEFEPRYHQLNASIDKILSRCISKLLTCPSLDDILNQMAQQVFDLIQYDRVMIYKFEEDGHGLVVAEVKKDGLNPFLGLHYPASDIPEQARQLYLKNPVRIIANVNSSDSQILSVYDKPVDLSDSTLRAVSPVHLQYLRIMGVRSSFSVSLSLNGKLWGLIACHNYSPAFIDYRAREAAKVLGQIASSLIAFKSEEGNLEKINSFNDVNNKLVMYMRDGDTLSTALTANSLTMKDVTDATGAALFFDGAVFSTGITPDRKQLSQIHTWLRSELKDTLFFTHSLSSVLPGAEDFCKTASGMLACLLSEEMNEYLVWFKAEQVQQVKWAGNPEKPVEISSGGLHQICPRKSFEEWVQTVTCTSEKWRPEEVRSALRLRNEVLYAVSRRANEVRMINEKLKRAYEELDTFSFTISHDLKNPLTVIKNFSEILLKPNRMLDEDSKRILGRIVRSAEKMNTMIKEILSYSRVGKTELSFAPVDMNQLMEDVKNEALYPLSKSVEFKVGELYDVKGDRTMLYQVFSNLVNNALKYSSKSVPQKISVQAKKCANEVVFSVTDNGIGMNTNNHQKAFELFSRLENATDYEGTGVGLAIVKRIIEKHTGRIWFESKLGEGTTFFIALPDL